MTLDAKTLVPVVVALFVGAGGTASIFVSRETADANAALAAEKVRVELATCEATLAGKAEALADKNAALDQCIQAIRGREDEP